MDEKHQEFRETSLRPSYSSNAIGHLVTGVKGFGIGILGGTTSIIAQSYDGARKDGFEVDTKEYCLCKSRRKMTDTVICRDSHGGWQKEWSAL